LTGTFQAIGQQLQIGVLRDYRVSKIQFSHSEGDYNVLGDGSRIATINADSNVMVQLSSGKVNVSQNSVLRGTFSSVKFVPVKGYGTLALTAKSPAVRQRKYQDAFEVKVVSGKMTIVNRVSVENYLCGVIESEGGSGKHMEYYKVQALMSRTYAMKNQTRHSREGFQLCDGVHCQAYHSKLRFTPDIRTAVRATRREVIQDTSGRFISTYFSANCGGQTCDASYVWNNSDPHCETFLDTFCIHTNQARWTHRIPQYKWKNFLVTQYGYPMYDSVAGPMIYTFNQEQRRAFYIHPSLGIPLRDLRSEFGLKSTFFSTHPEGSDVVLEGRGFGHGVGLCQEGAMNMAKHGYSYRQIALFYFTDAMVGFY